jgi:hypothetical protein
LVFEMGRPKQRTASRRHMALLARRDERAALHMPCRLSSLHLIDQSQLCPLIKSKCTASIAHAAWLIRGIVLCHDTPLINDSLINLHSVNATWTILDRSAADTARSCVRNPRTCAAIKRRNPCMCMPTLLHELASEDRKSSVPLLVVWCTCM